MIATALVLGTAAVLAFHLVRPVVVDLYLFTCRCLVAACWRVPGGTLGDDSAAVLPARAGAVAVPRLRGAGSEASRLAARTP